MNTRALEMTPVISSRAFDFRDTTMGDVMAGDVPRKLRSAMVGGGRGALIGDVHRKAMAFDGQIELVAGALSSTPDRARTSGRDLGLRDDRNHGRWQDLLDRELALPASERIDMVCIVTPNHVHCEVAKAFVEAGIHVVCDKPLVNSRAHADDLVRLVAKHDVVFGVTYNYTGYPMVRHAREMVRTGAIGTLRKVIVEYHQGWLATATVSCRATGEESQQLRPTAVARDAWPFRGRLRRCPQASGARSAACAPRCDVPCDPRPRTPSASPSSR